MKNQILNSNVLKSVQLLSSTRLVSDRVKELNNAGYLTKEMACGTGGVGSIKIRRSGEVYYQVSYGWTRYNYAIVVLIGNIVDNNFIPVK